MVWLYIINTEVPALGNSLSWDTNQCVCDITTVHDLFLCTGKFSYSVRVVTNGFKQWCRARSTWNETCITARQRCAHRSIVWRCRPAQWLRRLPAWGQRAVGRAQGGCRSCRWRMERPPASRRRGGSTPADNTESAQVGQTESTWTFELHTTE